MDTSEINKSLKRYSIFRGAFACDQIPKLKTRPVAYIVNTDRAQRSGEHWTAIMLLDNNRGEYFDSFGFPPLVPDVQEYVKTYCTSG